MAETEEGGEKEEEEEDEEEEQKNSDGFRMEEVSPPREKKRRKKARERDKKRRREEESEDLDEVRDPLMVFGSDILMMILTNLDARSVARSLLVSRGWCRVASSDRLWSPKCEELWLGKAHIPRISMVQGITRLQAYSFSIMDGKRRRILMDDLCDHTWEFRFKKTAPPYWLNLDPSWKGTGPPMHRYFHPDGTQTADPTDKVWGGHECRYSLVTSFVDEGRIREHYVRINRWPRMSVSRKEDWSWELSNHLYCYSSVPDADKNGGTGPFYSVWQETSY
ncbi:hypothetical protein MRB53_002763 [Persea americana]|uniref:Uncharacterized protein n=1 Tax=Persea americana TaxID=3435 RepID=A0ACC2MVQ9_PERAE|nr:hypothetical protein MRB53_002763 [Persea americana]|eukprot:TRINITY_DN2062_c0_g1_i1.p1 TRINITY_DN2062_c0_g1~~TRINITY_DN2062_c0_g1_i1.p1  ORF type:complete len:308 (-),score=58.61 TRINITY_DN2062_c0_g1_i1:355-1191(-)